MIVHTLVYRFPEDTDPALLEEFFTGLERLCLDSGLVTGFGRGPHLRLPVDDHARGMTATHVAQFSCPDMETLRKFSERPGTHEFISGWRARLSYEAAYANHELFPLT
ncbi:hypothetical protein RM780_05875 [Streptomyces sp. DSM 44917]|uniref:Stress-response A/B barrel domain-containing protein n=1 Tax=Streptomyces boetiae TaxID=3075541 RepID=A0ABU2L533_9ACTN|nr:hypothetical protein [Streptomyces sp. DSM 44917]MDT0306487.1 hypothetical protein [Streptomyces sp. DSM 44917]